MWRKELKENCHIPTELQLSPRFSVDLLEILEQLATILVFGWNQYIVFTLIYSCTWCKCVPGCIVNICNCFHGRGLVLNKQLLKPLLGRAYFCSDPTKVSKLCRSWYFKSRVYQNRVAVLLARWVPVCAPVALPRGSALRSAAAEQTEPVQPPEFEAQGDTDWGPAALTYVCEPGRQKRPGIFNIFSTADNPKWKQWT